MGWNEAQRTKYQPSNNNAGGGCLLVFFVILAFSFFKVAFETGNVLGVFLGIAVLAGYFSGRSSQ
jgi:hypothetical protein